MHGFQPLVHLVTQPSPAHAVELLGLTLVVAAVAFLLTRLSAAEVFSLGIGLEIFSGNWKYMHVPLPLDRVVLLLGLAVMVVGGVRRLNPERRLVFSPIHLLFVAVILYATLSAWGAGTLTTSTGFYALLDQLGLIPFVMFTLAPLLFDSHKGRNTLLVLLVVVGFYLGVIAFFEGVGLNHLVFPSYINNPAVGIHFGRARGPFVEAAANGLSMFICGAAALVALTAWRSRLARIWCCATVVLCLIGILFTLTREVWIGTVLGILVVAACDRRLRRHLPPVIAAGAIVSVVLLLSVPGLSSKVEGRASAASPVWDRYNTDRAALLAWEQHPVVGIGWDTFEAESVNYLRQAATYPLLNAGIDLTVHNVFLSILAELGLLGALLWVWAIAAGVGGAILRRGPPELYPWRLALIGIFTCYFVVANLGPLTYPFPNLMLWLWAGIVAADRYSAPRETPIAESSALAAGGDHAGATSSTSRAESGMSVVSSAKVP